MPNELRGRPPKGPRPEGESGLPSFLTERERSEIVEAMEGGAGRIMACHLLKVGYKRFLRTYREDRDFRVEVERADALKDEIALAVIYDGVAQGRSEKSAESYVKLKSMVRNLTAAQSEARKARKLKEREVELAHGGRRDDARPDLSRLTAEELAQYRSLLEKLGMPAWDDPSGVVIDVEGGQVPDAEPGPDPEPPPGG